MGLASPASRNRSLVPTSITKSIRNLSLAAAAIGAACTAVAGPLPLPPLGVYRGAVQTGKVDTYAAWLNQPDMMGLDFMAENDWTQVQGPNWILGPWQTWVAAKPGRRLILSVPMLPKTAGVSLATGATGAYNSNFSTLANNLVTRGLGNTVVRIGWEFNGGWYTWAAKGKETHFINYWRHIVTSMRYLPDGVTPRPGANFQFLWNPNHGYNQFPAELAYPGDAYVDLVGLDVYDQSWLKDAAGVYLYPWPATATAADIEARRAKVWTNDILNGNHGLAFWRNFCATHGKPFVLPEWGLMNRSDGHGGMDNAAFIANMHNYITTYPVAWASYFDYNNTVAASQLSPTSQHVNAQAKFLQLFSGSGSSALLSENFDDNVANNWTATPTARWSIVSDGGDPAYKYDFDWNNQTGLSTAGSGSWINQTLSVDFKMIDIQSWSEARLYFRHADSGNYYQLAVQDTGGTRRLQLRKNVAGTSTVLGTAGATLNANIWYTLAVDATASTITVRLNGAEVLQATDSSHAAGKVGLGAWKQDVLFDNVVVD